MDNASAVFAQINTLLESIMKFFENIKNMFSGIFGGKDEEEGE